MILYDNEYKFICITGKDRMKKPKLQRHVPCMIESLNIHLPPSMEKFEEELCGLLNEDRRNRENRYAGTHVSIVERRLSVSQIVC